MPLACLKRFFLFNSPYFPNRPPMLKISPFSSSWFLLNLLRVLRLFTLRENLSKGDTLYLLETIFQCLFDGITHSTVLGIGFPNQ